MYKYAIFVWNKDTIWSINKIVTDLSDFECPLIYYLIIPNSSYPLKLDYNWNYL